MKNKIVVVGCGNVGMAYIYALMNQSLPISEIVLIDTDERRIAGEVMDLSHGLAFSPNTIEFKVGSYEDCRDAAIVCITAGVSQNLGSRMDALDQNTNLFKRIVESVKNSGFTGIYLVASNPLDVMSYLTYKYGEVDPNRVIGSGTCLDTARLHYLIARELDVNPKNIEAYVLGEHGDTQFVPWHSATFALQKMDMFLSEEKQIEIEKRVREAGYEIVKRKGATYYGIGMVLSRITKAILLDEEYILPVSCYNKEHDVFFSKPAVIGKDGIKAKIYMELTIEEQAKLDASIAFIKEATKKTMGE